MNGKEIIVGTLPSKDSLKYTELKRGSINRIKFHRHHLSAI
jgi:hypothetical protein